jgi:hypothetical protein
MPLRRNLSQNHMKYAAKAVNYGKKFYNIDTSGQYYKTS